MLFAILGLICDMVLFALICHFSDVVPVKFVALTPIATIFGGANPTIIAIILSICADTVPESSRLAIIAIHNIGRTIEANLPYFKEYGIPLCSCFRYVRDLDQSRSGWPPDAAHWFVAGDIRLIYAVYMLSLLFCFPRSRDTAEIISL